MAISFASEKEILDYEIAYVNMEWEKHFLVDYLLKMPWGIAHGIKTQCSVPINETFKLVIFTGDSILPCYIDWDSMKWLISVLDILCCMK